MKLFQFLHKKLNRYDETHNFTCDICGREVFENERVCGDCFGALPWNNGAICPFCGRKLKEAGACLDCKQTPLEVDKARSCFTHEGEAARLVVRYKRGEKFLFRTLADLALPLLNAEFSEADALTFVPMTKKSERARGYNQSRLLAEELSRRSGKPLLTVLGKVKDTAAQKTLGRKEREENLKNAFRVTDGQAVKGKRLLLIDDTMTTGATASELALRLRRAGAAEVDLLTFTSVEKKDPFGKPPKEN